METQLVGLKSLRIFFSYAHEDRKIVGDLKKSLELIGFEVFLAHEDIEAGIEWQDEIRKNLERTDVLMPLFSEKFKQSNWTDQEVGIALGHNKFIIPLQLDKAPYGFIGKIQALKITNPVNNESVASEVFKIICEKSQFDENEKTGSATVFTEK